MSRIYEVAVMFPERVTEKGTRIGFSFWSDGKTRPYGRLREGRPIYGTAKGESQDELDALLADDAFLLAGDLGDGTDDDNEAA